MSATVQPPLRCPYACLCSGEAPKRHEPPAVVRRLGRSQGHCGLRIGTGRRGDLESNTSPILARSTMPPLPSDAAILSDARITRILTVAPAASQQPSGVSTDQRPVNRGQLEQAPKFGSRAYHDHPTSVLEQAASLY
jgi:hypothetical protein